MKKNRTYRGVIAGLAGLALILGGVSVASNMGFKFVPDCSSCLNLSVPWNNNYTNAQSLLQDLRTGGSVSSVQQFSTGPVLTTWNGLSGTNFSIVKSEAYIMNCSGGSTPVVVGSHDPSFLVSVGANSSYNASAPYHQTHTNAQALISDINAFCGGCISSVQRWECTPALTSWNGLSGTNFSLSLGAGVVLNTNATALTDYPWPHF